MGDFVKGHQFEDYPNEVQNGILLHRFIDSFTDEHPVSLALRAELRAVCGRYAGIAVDMVYDYALATQWHLFSDQSLDDFAQQTYRTLRKHWDELPDRAQFLLHYMEKDNWLLGYQSLEGMERSLQGMNRRMGGDTGLEEVGEWLVENYQPLVERFLVFFPEITNECHLKIRTFASAGY
jgi:acyl carrier protein phosphodiesterase